MINNDWHVHSFQFKKFTPFYSKTSVIFRVLPEWCVWYKKKNCLRIINLGNQLKLIINKFFEF